MGCTKNPDDNTLRERADIYLWDVIIPKNGSQPRLFDPPAVQTSSGYRYIAPHVTSLGMLV
jgi:hypothetical protein